MKTKVLVFGRGIGCEDYIDELSKLLKGVRLERAYFLEEALRAVKENTPHIIVLHLRHEVRAILELRISGFEGLIITDSSHNNSAYIADFDIRTGGIESTANVTLEMAKRIQILLNRPNKRRKSLTKNLAYYGTKGLSRIDTIMFLTNPVANSYLAMKVAKAKAHR